MHVHFFVFFKVKLRIFVFVCYSKIKWLPCLSNNWEMINTMNEIHFKVNAVFYSWWEHVSMQTNLGIIFFHELLKHVFPRCFSEHNYRRKLHTWMVSFSHELMICALSKYPWMKIGHHRHHIWTVSFLHELKKCVYLNQFCLRML